MEASVTSAQADYTIYREVVAQLMSGQEELPGLPSVTLDIRNALSRDDIPLRLLTKLIARDPSLSALLLKYASSGSMLGYGNHNHGLHGAPQTLMEVIQLLGVGQVERITMLHSVKSLFTLHSAGHKKLFMEAWERLILKSSICAFLARALGGSHGRVSPDHALLGSLLSEIGTLAVLSAFKTRASIPSRDVYVALCREYSKSLGVIMLTKWSVDEEYIQLVRKTGNWQADADRAFGLIDLVNLGLFHSLRQRASSHGLPPITALSGYQKLEPPYNFLTPAGELESVVMRRAEIDRIAANLH